MWPWPATSEATRSKCRNFIAMRAELAPLLAWLRHAVDARLNGVLVNWYDLSLDHYIGRHKDSPVGLVEGAPIVTVSYGISRTFVLERRSKRLELELGDGTVVISRLAPPAVFGEFFFLMGARTASLTSFVAEEEGSVAQQVLMRPFGGSGQRPLLDREEATSPTW